MMTISETWNLIDDFLVRGIFVSIVVILIAKWIFKNRINSAQSLRMVRMIFVIHSLVYLITFITALLLNNTDGTFLQRLRGPYWWAYWIMMIFNSVLPLTVLIKRPGNKIWYLLLVAVLMNIGWIMESLVIRTTAMEWEAMSPDYNPYVPSSYEAIMLTNGFMLGVLLVLIPNLYSRIRIQIKKDV